MLELDQAVETLYASVGAGAATCSKEAAATMVEFDAELGCGRASCAMTAQTANRVPLMNMMVVLKCVGDMVLSESVSDALLENPFAISRRQQRFLIRTQKRSSYRQPVHYIA